MGDLIDGDFESGASGASETYPQQCSSLRKNGHVMLKNHPCKIVEMSTSKTGKHGHAKVHLTGIDIFTGSKYEDICPSTHNMDVPNVQRIEYQLNHVDDDGFMSLMDDCGGQREDLKIPCNEIGKDVCKRCKEGETFMVTVLKAVGQETAIAFKPAT